MHLAEEQHLGHSQHPGDTLDLCYLEHRQRWGAARIVSAHTDSQLQMHVTIQIMPVIATAF